jgi:predicted transposase YbfD/YdcC
VPPAPAARNASTYDKGHGRTEKRTLRTTEILTVHEKWRGLKQGFELTRERTIGTQKTKEVVYGITSLSSAEANAERLLDLTRGHWRIENQLHYVRDVTLGEDASRVRKGSAPQVLAAFRNAVVHLLASVPADNNAAAIEYLQIHPEQAGKLIGVPQIE